MKCENYFCIYQAKGHCTLNEICLDISGNGTECIYVELDEGMIQESKQRDLIVLERGENS